MMGRAAFACAIALCAGSTGQAQNGGFPGGVQLGAGGAQEILAGVF